MLNRNSTSFPISMATKIESIYKKYKEEKDPMLMFHQYLIRDIMVDPIFGLGKDNNSRGLLIYHGMGLGKTILAASVLVSTLDIREPLILLNKSLRNNFSKNIKKLLNNPMSAAIIINKLKYISMDAFNFSQQVTLNARDLNGKLIIIDEAHNFFKAIINSSSSSSNAKQVYEMIMNAKDVRLLFLRLFPF